MMTMKSKQLLLELAFKAQKSRIEAVVSEIETATHDTKWTTTKGLDGITILISLISSTTLATVSRILQKYFERQENIVVELAIDKKKKYKFKGMTQGDIVAILKTLEADGDDN